MGIFDSLKTPDINQGVRDWSAAPGAVLLDVRTRQEYRDGHIPGSLNVPLHCLDDVDDVAENKSVPLFVYCRSGVRSRQATDELRRMGYANVKNIGGIISYTGSVER